jgi:hypothetical protein
LEAASILASHEHSPRYQFVIAVNTHLRVITHHFCDLGLQAAEALGDMIVDHQALTGDSRLRNSLFSTIADLLDQDHTALLRTMAVVTEHSSAGSVLFTSSDRQGVPGSILRWLARAHLADEAEAAIATALEVVLRYHSAIIDRFAELATAGAAQVVCSSQGPPLFDRRLSAATRKLGADRTAHSDPNPGLLPPLL